jgi:hypothetical protein
MKAKLIRQFLINILFYTAIAISLYYLYSPLNDNPNNATHSAIHFVYQQF